MPYIPLHAQVGEPLVGFKPTLGLDIMFASSSVVSDTEEYVLWLNSVDLLDSFLGSHS